MKELIARTYGKLEIKKQQYILAGVLGLIAVAVICTVLWRINAGPIGNKKREAGVEAIVPPKRIETAASRTDEQEIWRYGMQQDKEKLSNEIEDIKKILAGNMTEKEMPKANQEIEELKQELTELREFMMNRLDVTPKATTDNLPERIKEPEAIIEKISFNLEDNKANAIKNIENTIPAGAFAKAVLLGGVDASTASTAQNNPRPMLIRLIDMGTLPRRFKSDLKDCDIIAGAYGDISSERAMVRLEKLTCVERQTEEIIETQVSGYVAGEDGIQGIRGVVVEKGREYLTNSIVGGLLQGLAGVMTPQQAMVSNPFAGVTLTQQESPQNKFGRGLGTGMAGSMEILSKHYLSALERLQPVIQIAAGRVVDVVFTEGTAIGTELVKKKLEEKRARSQKEEATGE